MNIIVLAAASRIGGALTVFRQFLKYLPSYIGDDKYYIFKDSHVDAPFIGGVEYINDSDHSFKHRIYFDSIGLKKWCHQRDIIPDLVISFQNSASKLKCRQIVYYHQSLPFYPEKWSLFKREERALFFYKNIYPLFVSRTLTGNVEIVVQTESLRGMFAKCYNFDINNTYALFPDVEEIDVNSIATKILDKDNFHFIYPAIAAKYKRHSTIVEAVALLRQRGFSGWDKIRVYFTIPLGASPELYAQIDKLNLNRQFVFLGQLAYQELLVYYKSVDGLIFPSSIETIGLPLLEAASFGLPIVATDRMYAKDVLKVYEGATFIDSFTPSLWADAIKSICEKRQRFMPLLLKESEWPKFFNIVHDK